MLRSQGFPFRTVQVFKAYFAFRPGKADLRPQPGFFFVPGDPGIFPLFLFAGLSGLHDQGVSVRAPLDADEAVAADQQAQAGHVAGAQIFRVHGHFCRAAGKEGPLGQRVPGELQGAADLVRADHIGAVSGFPAAFPGLMVELPDVLQRGGSEIVAVIQGLRGPAGADAGIGDLLCRLAEDRVAEPVPGDGDEYGNPADRAAVLEDYGEPSAVRRIHNAALGRPAAEAVQVAVINVAPGPDAVQAVRHEAGLGPVPFPLAGVNQEEDIFTVDLIEMGTFISQEFARSVPDDDPVQAAFLRSGKVRFQFCQMNIPVAVDDIDPAVVVEEQGAVVVDPFDILFRPGAFDILRREQKGFRPLVGDESHIEAAGVIPERRGPHAVAVDRLSAFQDLARGVLQEVIDIGADLPVDQVVRPKDHGARKEVHGRADHVVGVSDTDYIRIRIIHTGQGIEAFLHTIASAGHILKSVS